MRRGYREAFEAIPTTQVSERPSERPRGYRGARRGVQSVE